jgi:hypothetical protein
MTIRSGSRSWRPKNIRIRIRNTAFGTTNISCKIFSCSQGIVCFSILCKDCDWNFMFKNNLYLWRWIFPYKTIALAFLALNFGPAAPPPSSTHSPWAVTGKRFFLRMEFHWNLVGFYLWAQTMKLFIDNRLRLNTRCPIDDNQQLKPTKAATTKNQQTPPDMLINEELPTIINQNLTTDTIL